MTEWNVSAGGWGLMSGKFLTLDTALLNARYLNLLCRYSNIVDIACRSNMTNSLGSGIIGTRPGGLLLRPSYHVMKLYADHLKPVPLAVNNPPDGLDVTACVTESKDALCVFVVNPKPEPVTTSIDLSEFGTAFQPVAGEVVCDTLDARQLDVMNHWTAPDRVRTIKLSIEGSRITLPAVRYSHRMHAALRIQVGAAILRRSQLSNQAKVRMPATRQLRRRPLPLKHSRPWP